ncbi:MAG: hypothetical protein A3J55_04300 [Candidatus Ryanbacteria bacterium RIFCSPHIGHO2_02_FULL_45_17b]|uniref:Uncharacterized protein n=1 Tax=Candidatus Ryanbacteria bacterium RIFCSPHIGHO2_01_FULL_45_22 TaxID=1802114 RepID=A0A1G2G1J1_9BACT|nr:MAG: hypothetical protein A2719_02435 [Candidatus Ryanbacteria bacterium RIFCSPHIGHO2_01_FULL_45_22]OGZ46493.1 MAG: hypothetical protein A3J55_04300 [Candidatus Ryanbacteria bacterium RIFCSPHIGHO2_02_FULL_45_17b]
METIQNKYIPGVCNIGDEEIKMRKRAGWGGLIATIILWGLFIWFNTPQIWRLTLFFPAMMSATGFLQAYMHFCAYFGFASLFNFGDVGKTDSVGQAEFRAKDKKKAWQIVIYSVLIGLAVAIIAFII